MRIFSQRHAQKIKIGSFLVTTIILAVLSDVSGTEIPWISHGKLGVSPNQRHLEHADGTPFFWLGDTAWQLFKELTRAEIDQYLQNRQGLKFNVVMSVLLAEYHDVPGRKSPAGLGPNAYGHEPLIDQDPARPRVVAGGSSTKPNDYWDHVDYAVAQARDKGLYIGLLPCWGWNYVNGGGSRGNLQIFNEAKAKIYGEFLGKRFRKYPNIIWIIGGDDEPVRYGDCRSIYRAMVEGIAKGVTGKDIAWIQESPVWDRLLMTFHPRGGLSSSTFFHNDPWLDFNFLQTGHNDFNNLNSCIYITRDRQLQPIKPVLEGEPRYEDCTPFKHQRMKKRPHFRDFDVRQAAYWSVFAGSHGFTYGHHSIWQFHAPKTEGIYFPEMTWQEALNRPGARHMTFLRDLMESRPLGNLSPDQSPIVSDNKEDGTHLRAFRGDRYIYVYNPHGITFKIKMGLLPGTNVQASWSNPRTGITEAIGNVSNTDIREFDPPGEAKKGNDWVLILEGKI